MSKKISKQEPKAPLTQQEVAQLKIEDETAKLQAIMGFGLAQAYKVGLELDSKNPARVVEPKGPMSKVANVDALPEPKKNK